jgi:ABC-2 type transport system permease protein
MTKVTQARRPRASAAPVDQRRLPEAHPRTTARPHLAVSRLWIRLARRSALMIAVAIGVYVVVEVASYRAAYPSGVSPIQFKLFEDNPVSRMMQGVPVGLGTPGGFTVWDGGWFMQLIICVWALLMTTRLLRGEEDAGRSDLVLAGRVRAGFHTASAFAVVSCAAVLIGGTAALALILSGQGARGAVLFGLGLAGVAATFAGVAAVMCQLVDVRRRAAGFTAVALAVAYLLRMVANSSDARVWARWASPLAWMDSLAPYGSPDLRALLPFVLAPILLGWLAVTLRAKRDLGGALLVTEAGHEPHLGLLRSPLAFAWRGNRAVLAGWAAGLVMLAAVMGALISTMMDWLAKDQDYQRLFKEMGYDQALTTLGFVAVMAQMFGLAIALYVVWRLGAARADEEAGRAEVLLSRPVSRLRCLSGHAVLAALGGMLLLLLTGAAFWLGCVTTGFDDVSWGESMRSMLNSLPVVVLVGGFTVLTFGLLPRLTVALPVTLTVVAYLLTMLGPPLSWPSWLLDLSPFTHLAWVPMAPWGATAGLVMSALGLGMCALGLLTFRRRDLLGG